MKYTIIYNTTKVLTCEPYLECNALALGGGAQVLVTTLQEAKLMLDTAGISYEHIPELVYL